MQSKKIDLRKMLLSAMFLAIAIILPFLTGQIRELGNALCPMHIPAMLCGIFCGPWWGALVGFIAPLLRSMLFSMPVIIPSGIAMAFELACYGIVVGFLYRKKLNIYLTLLCAMLLGRIVSVGVRLALYGLGKSSFAWASVLATTFTNTIPGMIAQLIIIPLLVIAINRNKEVIS